MQKPQADNHQLKTETQFHLQAARSDDCTPFVRCNGGLDVTRHSVKLGILSETSVTPDNLEPIRPTLECY
jgi:hypothetical protein